MRDFALTLMSMAASADLELRGDGSTSTSPLCMYNHGCGCHNHMSSATGKLSPAIIIWICRHKTNRNRAKGGLHAHILECIGSIMVSHDASLSRWEAKSGV